MNVRAQSRINMGHKSGSRFQMNANAALCPFDLQTGSLLTHYTLYETITEHCFSAYCGTQAP